MGSTFGFWFSFVLIFAIFILGSTGELALAVMLAFFLLVCITLSQKKDRS